MTQWKLINKELLNKLTELNNSLSYYLSNIPTNPPEKAEWGKGLYAAWENIAELWTKDGYALLHIDSSRKLHGLIESQIESQNKLLERITQVLEKTK